MIPRNPDMEWEKFGKKEPYYGGGINKNKFRQENIDKASLEEFFASGQEHMEFILGTIRKIFHPEFFPYRTLDFGCGVGRCAIPMAKLFPEVVGVDISESVLKEAREISSSHSLNNVEFYKSDDNLLNVPGKFELIHSTFVFQHISPDRGLNIIQRLVERLSENGVAALGFLIHRGVSPAIRLIGSLRKWLPGAHGLANLLEGKPFFEPYAEKNVYHLNRVLKILHEKNCGNVYTKIFQNGNHLDAILFFQKTRDRVPHESFYKD